MAQYTLTDGIVDSFCVLLAPFVNKKLAIPGTTRKDRIKVMYNQTDIGLLMFNFVTRHDPPLEIQLPFEMDRLAKEGKDYFHGRIEMLSALIPKALEERQKENRPLLDINLSDMKKNPIMEQGFQEPEPPQIQPEDFHDTGERTKSVVCGVHDDSVVH